MRSKTSAVVSISTLVVFASLLIFSGGCATDSKVIAQAQEAHATLQPAVITDPQLAGYLQQVGDRVVEAARQYDKEGRGPESHKNGDSKWMFDTKAMQFHFVNSKTLNAFTTGGEHMYVYTQLFEECKSEDELAAVMAHEFSHVYSRHVQKGMNRQIAVMGAAVGAQAVGSAAGSGEGGSSYASTAAGAVSTAAQFAGMRFTRDDENEADKIGFSLYSRAGWDPNHFADFFQHMIDQGLDTTPEYMSDHPSLKNRVIATKERIKNLGDKAVPWRRDPIASVAQFQALQQRAVQVGGTIPDDQSLQKTQLMLAAIPRSCWTPLDGNLKDQKDAQSRLDQLIAASTAKKK